MLKLLAKQLLSAVSQNIFLAPLNTGEGTNEHCEFVPTIKQ